MKTMKLGMSASTQTVTIAPRQPEGLPPAEAIQVVLISTYELGHQPFGLASPAAWLRRAGADVRCLDLSLGKLDEEAIAAAHLVAFYVPMHTATRIAVNVIKKVRRQNASAHLCAYGLYAPVNAEYLRELGCETILGGEFEEGLLSLTRRLSFDDGESGPVSQVEPEISLERQKFVVPDRSDLPVLSEYAYLTASDGSRRTVGYTEASRGCKHLCRHCPIVPVYEGKFRIVQRDVVIDDIRRQVAAGAQHITFGDPDFFNGIKHAVALLREFHGEFPGVTYDVTIKVEHLLKHMDCLPLLRETGCAFVTTAVEAVDDTVLEYLDKGHTRADFIEVVRLFRECGLVLSPTFVAFHPWTTLESYQDWLSTLVELDLVNHLAPVQLAIRLLIPSGSRLLELPQVRDFVGEYDQQALNYPWKHPDPRVDCLQAELQSMVAKMVAEGGSRVTIFEEAWRRLEAAMGNGQLSIPVVPQGRQPVHIPYLSEPWYCCAEPTEEQVAAF